jgi:hypothetical protein
MAETDTFDHFPDIRKMVTEPEGQDTEETGYDQRGQSITEAEHDSVRTPAVEQKSAEPSTQMETSQADLQEKDNLEAETQNTAESLPVDNEHEIDRPIMTDNTNSFCSVEEASEILNSDNDPSPEALALAEELIDGAFTWTGGHLLSTTEALNASDRQIEEEEPIAFKIQYDEGDPSGDRHFIVGMKNGRVIGVEPGYRHNDQLSRLLETLKEEPTPRIEFHPVCGNCLSWHIMDPLPPGSNNAPRPISDHSNVGDTG